MYILYIRACIYINIYIYCVAYDRGDRNGDVRIGCSGIWSAAILLLLSLLRLRKVIHHHETHWTVAVSLSVSGFQFFLPSSLSSSLPLSALSLLCLSISISVSLSLFLPRHCVLFRVLSVCPFVCLYVCRSYSPIVSLSRCMLL